MSKSTWNQLPQISFTLVWFSGVILLIFLVDIPVGLGLSFDGCLGVPYLLSFGVRAPCKQQDCQEKWFQQS